MAHVVAFRLKPVGNVGFALHDVTVPDTVGVVVVIAAFCV